MYILYLRIALSKYIVVSDRCAYGVIFRLLLFLRDFMVFYGSFMANGESAICEFLPG